MKNFHFLSALAFVVLTYLHFGCDNSVSDNFWFPIKPNPSTGWRDAQDLCFPLLQKSQETLLRSPPKQDIDIRGPYDLCMQQEGWVFREEENTEHSVSAGIEINEFLETEIIPRRRKTELTKAFGNPSCIKPIAGNKICGPNSNAPEFDETETCSWRLDYQLSSMQRNLSMLLTCLVPKTNELRSTGSCHLDAM